MYTHVLARLVYAYEDASVAVGVNKHMVLLHTHTHTHTPRVAINRWFGEYKCGFCVDHKPTTLGAHACAHRCELKPVCQDCHASMAKVQARHNALSVYTPDPVSSDGFPAVRPEEEVIA